MNVHVVSQEKRLGTAAEEQRTLCAEKWTSNCHHFIMTKMYR